MQEEENSTGVSRIERASVSTKWLFVSVGSVCGQREKPGSNSKDGVSCMWCRGTPKSWSCRVKSKLVPWVRPPQELQSCICAVSGHDLHRVADRQAGAGAGRVRVCYSSVCSWHYRLSRVIAHSTTCPLTHSHCPGLPPAGSQLEGRPNPLQLWSRGKHVCNRSCLLAFLRPRTPTRGQ